MEEHGNASTVSDQREQMEQRQNEINHLIADEMSDSKASKRNSTCDNFQHLIRSQTETLSLATTLDSTLYNTPMTSFSGFDVYLTAEEESSYSMNRQINKTMLSDNQISTESKDNTENERRIQVQRSEPNLAVRSAVDAFKRSGKGGERIGQSGKFSPKRSGKGNERIGQSGNLSMNKMIDSSARPKIGKTENVNNNCEHNNFKSNGSLKVHVPDFKEDTKRAIGGTKAILIQKVGFYLPHVAENIFAPPLFSLQFSKS